MLSSVIKLILFGLYPFLYIRCCAGTVNIPKNVVIPAVIAFGDSIMDQGNNNYVKTVLKSNFSPYGKDFVDGKPTGRFSNGKTLADVFAKKLGVKEYLPAYLDPNIQDKDLITGVSFASGGSGYDPLTPMITSVIPLSAQVEMFKEYISKLRRNIGEEAAMNVITECVYFISASSNDFIVNYFAIPTRRLQYDVPAYSNMLVEFAASFIQDIYKLGARRIAVLSAAPIGCVPFERTVSGGAHRICVDKYNKAAQLYNSILKQKLQFLSGSLARSRVAYVDFYNPFLSFIENPRQYGFEVADKGCCGTGEVEVSILCNKITPTCYNDSMFLFWDSIHPSEKGYTMYADYVLQDLLNSLF